MRKNKTSNTYTFKLSVIAIGLGSAMAINAQNTTSTPSATTTTTGTSTGSILPSGVSNTVNSAISTATGAVNSAISSIQNGGTTTTTSSGSTSTGSTFTSGASSAAGTIATTAVVPQYTQAQLDAAGCDAGVWSKMVSDYQRQASEIAALDTEQLTRQLVKATPPISSMAGCFDQAANIINSATAIYTTITKLLTGGGLDSNQLLQYGKDLLTKYACSLVDSYVASTGIAGTLNSVNNLPNQVLGTNVGVGGVNSSVGNILQGGGYQQGQGTSTGQVTGSNIAGTVSNTLSNTVPGFK